MRSRTANWFETRVRYDKMMEDGQNKKTTETYVVDAYTFGEAEEAITKEMGAYINGEFEVKAITPAPMARSSSATPTATTSGSSASWPLSRSTTRRRRRSARASIISYRRPR